MSADDFKDYLNQQAQGAQALQRLQDMPGRDPEREAADVAQAVEDSASDVISYIADQAESADEGFLAVLDETRDLRSRIAAGSLTVDDAKQALISLRGQHGRLTATVTDLQPRYAAAVETVKNPGTRRDQLIDKYPGLRGGR